MKTILVVDADPLERNIAIRCLTDAGYYVLEAANYAEAMHIARLHNGDIHLSVIANAHAIDIAKAIFAIRTTQSILITSSDPEDQVPLSSMPATANFAFLQKPFFPTVFLKKVQSLLDPK